MHPTDRARTVWLHGKPYWWTTEDGRLVLRPAHWLLTVPADPPPAPVLADLVQWLAAQPHVTGTTTGSSRPAQETSTSRGTG